MMTMGQVNAAGTLIDLKMGKDWDNFIERIGTIS